MIAEMSKITEMGKSVGTSTPVLAIVGATDLAVERLRAMRSSTAAQQLPAQAVGRALQAAGQFETGYSEMAERGKRLIDRLRTQQSTHDLLAQGSNTLSRGRAAVTTARRAVDDTTSVALGALSATRRDGKQAAREVAGTARAQVAKSVAESQKVVEARAARSATVRKRAVATASEQAKASRTAAKGAATSTRKTASAAAKAAAQAADELGVDKIGD